MLKTFMLIERKEESQRPRISTKNGTTMQSKVHRSGPICTEETGGIGQPI